MPSKRVKKKSKQFDVAHRRKRDGESESADNSVSSSSAKYDYIYN